MTLTVSTLTISVVSLSLPILAILISPFLRPREGAIFSGAIFFISFLMIIYNLFVNNTFNITLFNATEPIGRIYIFGDTISHAYGFTIAFVSAMVAFYSLPYMEHRFKEMEMDTSEFKKYWFLYNLYASSMLWLVYAGNLILLYIFLEISLVTSFLLIYYYGYGDREWVALLYFVWTHIAGALAIIGFLIVGFENKTLALSEIKFIGMTAWLLIFLGMIVKLPGFGAHIWLPWAHAEAPTPVSALLSPLTVGLASYILLRIYFIDSSFIEMYRIPIFVYGAFTSLYAGFSVFRQTDFKRLLAYSTVSQMGYILIALTLGTAGIIGVVIQYISHAFGKSILFMSAGSLIAVYRLRDIEKMGGLHEQVPTISNASLIGFMNLSGILTIGMIGEFYILKGLTDTFGLALLFIFLVVLVFIVSGLYSFYTMKRIYYGTPKDYSRVEVDRFLDVPLYVIACISILLLLPPMATWFINSILTTFGGGF